MTTKPKRKQAAKSPKSKPHNATQFSVDTQRAIRDLSAYSIVNMLGPVEDRIAPLKQDLARQEKLRRALRDLYATEAADYVTTIEGDLHVCIIGGNTLRRKVNGMKELAREMGDAFFENCTISLEAVEQHFGRARAGLFFTEAQDGPRPLTIAPNPKAMIQVAVIDGETSSS